MNSNNDNNTGQVLEINTDSIELYKILKLEGMAASGGEAKQRITEGCVSVNGETETRKRKKIVAGDLVQFAGIQVSIRRKK